MTNEISARSRLYGRSKGKALRQRQSDLMTSLLPRLLIDLANPIKLRERRETRLEIG
ncbi:MAG: tRNA (guanosine(46)-N7)-methyltransferase TrmB, partial [Alphaproteobacteria bacterium]|nr:tRNA (guanosine(46)-N7)-methyltransferase TrmB [Alphaproteobacteria bacterium]